MADSVSVPFSLTTDSIVSCVKFGPCQHCTALLAVATASTLSVKKCTLKVKDYLHMEGFCT